MESPDKRPGVLLIAAHPDDEAIGCGGTLFRLKSEGWRIGILYMADGVSSREGGGEDSRLRSTGREEAISLLTPDYVKSFNFPDNKMDTIPLLDVAKAIENTQQEFKAERVITHWEGDLNIDHRLTCEAALIASRPQPGSLVKSFWTFSVKSSTDYAFRTPSFHPTKYVDISDFKDDKRSLLKAYIDELRPFPHARSIEAIEAENTLRGSEVGRTCIEAFEVKFEII